MSHVFPLAVVVTLLSTGVVTPLLDLDPDGFHEEVLVPTESSSTDFFGTSIATQDGALFVGAPWMKNASTCPRGCWQGAAILFEPMGTKEWRQTRIMASDGAHNAHFGHSVAMYANTLVVGAPYTDHAGDYTGSAYLFEHNASGEWRETRFVASDAAERAQFGISVAVAADLVVVGTRYQTFWGDRTGAVYVYERGEDDGWVETKLKSPRPVALGQFGHAVATDGTRIVVGAFEEGWGRVYVYEANATGVWVPEALETPAGAKDFGYAVALDGDRLVVGAPDNGRVYILDARDGAWDARRLRHDADRFGASVAVDGRTILVGAPLESTRYAEVGAAFLYRERDDGTFEEFPLEPEQQQELAHFGGAVALAGDRAVVGAPFGWAGGENGGRVHTFDAACLMHVKDHQLPERACEILGDEPFGP